MTLYEHKIDLNDSIFSYVESYRVIQNKFKHFQLTILSRSTKIYLRTNWYINKLKYLLIVDLPLYGIG